MPPPPRNIPESYSQELPLLPPTKLGEGKMRPRCLPVTSQRTTMESPPLRVASTARRTFQKLISGKLKFTWKGGMSRVARAEVTPQPHQHVIQGWQSRQQRPGCKPCLLTFLCRQPSPPPAAQRRHLEAVFSAVLTESLMSSSFPIT